MTVINAIITLWELFISFFKIGLFTFGGGYPMIRFISNEVINHGWMTLSRFYEIVAVSQITPGPIAVNMATFVGFTQSGVSGSVIATLGVVSPAFLLMLAVTRFLKRFYDAAVVKKIFWALRPVVLALVISAAIQIALAEFFPGSADFSGLSDWTAAALFAVPWRAVILAIAAFAALITKKLGPVWVIVLSAAAGVFLL
jgi:chromate transporter